MICEEPEPGCSRPPTSHGSGSTQQTDETQRVFGSQTDLSFGDSLRSTWPSDTCALRLGHILAKSAPSHDALTA